MRKHNQTNTVRDEVLFAKIKKQVQDKKDKGVYDEFYGGIIFEFNTQTQIKKYFDHPLRKN